MSPSLPSSLDLESVSRATRPGSEGRLEAEFRGFTLKSAFQPIFSLAHRRAVGYEGLLRAFRADGSAVPPMEVFRLAEGDHELTYLDRLCRVLHLNNFNALPDPASWLFVNLNPHVVVEGRQYGSFFAELMRSAAMPPHRVVVEILEGAIHDEGLLADAIHYYRELGCLVAIDDFGAGHSNFERIWRIAPHIVKLDRSISAQAPVNRRARHVLPNLVNLIHEAGSLALMEGLETEEEALIAMDADVDFVQGFHFARPAEHPDVSYACDTVFGGLCDKFKLFRSEEAQTYRQRLAPYLTGFRQAMGLLESGLTMEDACAKFLRQNRVHSCYLLDMDGHQIGGNMDAADSATDPRFTPLTDARGANWSRRHYFRHAVNMPGQIQITNPYLSIATSRMCVTLSVTVQTEDEMRVLCCDVDWGE